MQDARGNMVDAGSGIVAWVEQGASLLVGIGADDGTVAPPHTLQPFLTYRLERRGKGRRRGKRVNSACRGAAAAVHEAPCGQVLRSGGGAFHIPAEDGWSHKLEHELVGRRRGYAYRKITLRTFQRGGLKLVERWYVPIGLEPDSEELADWLRLVEQGRL